MIVEFNINKDLGLVNVMEKTEYGTKKNKTISLDEFLQIYTSYVKEKEDNYEYLFLPPGTIEYKKNINSLTFFIETYPYKEFYGVDSDVCDYAIIMKTNLEGTKATSFQVFATKGAFNRHFSVFSKIIECNKPFDIENEEDGIKKCLAYAKEISLDVINYNLKYKNIM